MWEKLLQRLSWQYPFVTATTQPAKASVTALRRRAAEVADDWSLITDYSLPGGAKTPVTSNQLSVISERASAEAAQEVGSAHHLFLQHVLLQLYISLPTLNTHMRLKGVAVSGRT